MLFDYLIHKTEKLNVPIEINQSKCSRFRFGSSKCDVCIKFCPHDAITISDELEIDIELCNGCLGCASVCKSEALSVGFMLHSVEKLKQNHRKILLGCTRKDNIHHFRKRCIGWLSKETLYYLSSTFEDGVYIDVRDCHKCINKEAFELVEQFLSELHKKDLCNNVFLTEKRNESEKHSNSFNRRDFFRFVKGTAKAEASDYVSSMEQNKIYFSDKSLPLKRNAVLACKDKRENFEIESKEFNYQVMIEKNCTECLECTAVCITEALFENDDNTLGINEDRCTGCNLCEEFCSAKAITITNQAQLVYTENTRLFSTNGSNS